MAIEYVSFPVGPLRCNFSLIWDPHTKGAYAVDPGGDFKKIQAEIESRKLTLKGILHTHAHFDHLGASEELADWSKAPLHLHPGDKPLWENLSMQGRAFGIQLETIRPYDHELKDEFEFLVGSDPLKVLHTPGHTPGSCCFSVGEILFAGDTLFQGSIGRTDLWGGDYNQISKSIKDRLYCLEPDTIVITGHGPKTKIGIERKQNAFIRA